MLQHLQFDNCIKGKMPVTAGQNRTTKPRISFKAAGS